MATKKQNANNVFGNEAYWIVNKKMAMKYGIEFTLIFQHLFDLQKNIFGNKEFFQQQWRISEHINLSERTVHNIIKKLEAEGFLQRTKKGMPAKNYYLINESFLLEFLTTDDEEDEDSVS